MLCAGTVYPNGELIPMGESLRSGSDELIRSPLWWFRPLDRPLVIAERYRRGFISSDPEPIGDPEYT